MPKTAEVRFYENGMKCFGRGHEEEVYSGRQEFETSKRKAVLLIY
jgi:hypothetical protein